MAATFYDENDPRKKREMRGDKTPIDMPKEIAGNFGVPHSNVRIDTGVNAETGETYKRVLPDYGAAGFRGKTRPKKGKA